MAQVKLKLSHLVKFNWIVFMIDYSENTGRERLHNLMWLYYVFPYVQPSIYS